MQPSFMADEYPNHWTTQLIFHFASVPINIKQLYRPEQLQQGSLSYTLQNK